MLVAETVTWDDVRGVILGNLDTLSLAIVRSSLDYVDVLEKRDAPPFQDVYSTPEGFLVLEWRIEGGTVYKIGINSKNRGRLVVFRGGEQVEERVMSWGR